MSPAPPRALVLLSAGVVALGGLVVLVGGWRTGISWDEGYHVLRMRNFLEHGWYLLDGDLLGGRPGPWEQQQYVYGPVTMLLLQAWGALWGGDAGTVQATAHAYAVRHLGIGLVALAGVAAAAGLTRLLLRRWAWGLVTAAVLLALPVWAGHAMFNVKDVPVATGFTLVTLGLALLVLRDEGARPRLRLAAGCLALLAGVVLAVGTRPGIWPGLALGVAVVLVTRDRVRVVAVLGTLVAAYGVLLAVYPAAFSTPVAALLGGALESSRFGGEVGQWWYLPLFLLVEVPLLLLAAALAGTAVAARGLWRRRTRLEPRDVVVLLVVVQCFALPVLAVLRQSNVYTGVRQMLFAAPATAVLATLGVAALLAARARWRRPVARALVPVAVVVALVVPLASQLQLFPYSYAYSTPLATAASPVVERATGYGVPTDYWRTSVRELAPAVPATGWVTCSPTMDGEGRWYRWSRDTHEDCAGEVVSPLAAYDARRSGTWDDDPTRFLAVQTGGTEVASNCHERHAVERWLLWQRVTMGVVAECDLVLPPLSPGGVDLDDTDGSGQGGETLLGGWRLHPAQVGGAVDDAGATLGFTWPGAGGTDLRVNGTAVGAGGIGLSVNGVPVPVEVTGTEAWTAQVPAAAAGAYGEDRVVLRLTGAGVRVLELQVEALGGGTT